VRSCAAHACDLVGAPDFKGDDFEAKRAGGCLNLAHFDHGGGVVDICQDRQPAQPRDSLAQEFETFASKIASLGRHAGDIAARPHQTRDQSGAERVRSYREYNRNDGCPPAWPRLLGVSP
jgi:hypothetical protein